MEKRPQQGESQNNPQLKEVEISSSAINVTTAGSRKKHNQQPHNTYTQTGGGTHNPQIQGVSEIANKGSINMGSSSSMTNHFNNSGNNANKQIQGVNGSRITM